MRSIGGAARDSSLDRAAGVRSRRHAIELPPRGARSVAEPVGDRDAPVRQAWNFCSPHALSRNETKRYLVCHFWSAQVGRKRRKQSALDAHLQVGSRRQAVRDADPVQGLDGERGHTQSPSTQANRGTVPDRKLGRSGNWRLKFDSSCPGLTRLVTSIPRNLRPQHSLQPASPTRIAPFDPATPARSAASARCSAAA